MDKMNPVYIMKVAPVAIAGLVAAGAAIALAPAAPGQSKLGRSVPGPFDVGAPRCAALTGKTLGGATIEKAEYISKGSPTIAPIVKAENDVCRVTARATPVPGSVIKMRIWLPTNWNGKMLGIGGAGLNGGVAAEWFMAVPPMNEGYAIFVTDAGHEFIEDDAKWALGQPEKVKDYAYRANHQGTLATKAVIGSYYRQSPKRSYFHGCSNGGRDALIQAQRYPEDWDGIVAGAPASDYTGIMTNFAHIAQIAEPHRRAGVLGPKMKMVADAVLKQCDAADGLKDGLISNPTQCRFDPAVLQCKAGNGSDCLSSSEVGTLRTLYEGSRTSAGKLVMPGFSPGSEADWASWFTRPEKNVAGGMQEVFRYMVYADPTWSWRNFDIDRDYAAIKRRLGPIVDATDTDLRRFAGRGGKLLMYHGWEDTLIPAGNSIRYFEAARARLGDKADQVRLFMVPGQAHCFGGSGPNVVDFVGALDRWVDGGKAPERLTAGRHDNLIAAVMGQPTKLLQTRPVCAWPKTPYHDGRGAGDDEASFTCR